jgi:hypothetical protein
VLLLLDNVSHAQHMADLLPQSLVDRMGPGSKVVLTTRDGRLLNGTDCRTFDIPVLSPDASLTLFRHHTKNRVELQVHTEVQQSHGMPTYGCCDHAHSVQQSASDQADPPYQPVYCLKRIAICAVEEFEDVFNSDVRRE